MNDSEYMHHLLVPSFYFSCSGCAGWAERKLLRLYEDAPRRSRCRPGRSSGFAGSHTNTRVTRYVWSDVTANLIRSMCDCVLDIWCDAGTYHILLDELSQFHIGLGVLRRQLTWGTQTHSEYCVSTVLISTWCITFHICGSDSTFDPRGGTFGLRGWDDGLPMAFHLLLVQPVCMRSAISMM